MEKTAGKADCIRKLTLLDRALTHEIRLLQCINMPNSMTRSKKTLLDFNALKQAVVNGTWEEFLLQSEEKYLF